MKRCPQCLETKPYDCFYKSRSSKHGVSSYCKSCSSRLSLERYHNNKEHCRALHAEWCEKNYAKLLLNNAKCRAKKKGLPYTLTPDDVQVLNDIIIEGRCELSGIPFTTGNGQTWDSPSIDRIDSTRGYEPGNVRVVIHGLNMAMGNWGLDITIEFVEAAKRKLEKRA